MMTRPSIGSDGGDRPATALHFELAHWTVYECIIAVLAKALNEDDNRERAGAVWWADRLTRLCCEAPEKAKTITRDREENDDA